MVKNPTITETIRVHRLCWLGHVQRMEENRIPKRILSMKVEATRPRGRPRHRWQDEVSERMEEWLAKKSGRKKYTIEKNGKRS
jgi:hypothetical protein